MKQIPGHILCLSLILQTIGCTTLVSNENESSNGSAIEAATEAQNSSHPFLEGADRRRDVLLTLEANLDNIEQRGDRYLESGFRLFNLLLEIEERSDLAVQRQVAATVTECQKLYDDLLTAIFELKRHMDEPSFRRIHREAVKRDPVDYEGVTAAFTEFYSLQHQNLQDSLVAAQDHTDSLLVEGGETGAEALALKPSPQQDAFLLLDHLRELSYRLTYVSSSVSGWLLDLNEPDYVMAH